MLYDEYARDLFQSSFLEYITVRLMLDMFERYWYDFQSSFLEYITVRANGASAMTPVKGREQVEEKAAIMPNYKILAGVPETIPVDMVRPNPLNPRAKYDRSQIDDMAKSITAHGGLIYPILLRKVGEQYEIISGHLRFMALKKLGRTELITGKDAVVLDIEEKDAIRLMVDDNLKRWNYNPAEAARAIDLLRNYVGLTMEEIAEQYGINRTMITRVLKVATLPDDVAKKVSWGRGFIATGQKKEKGAITVLHAAYIAGLDSNENKIRVAKAVEKYSLSTAETKKVVELVKKDPWKPVDEHVVAVRSMYRKTYTVVVENRDLDEALQKASADMKEKPETAILQMVADWLAEHGYISAEDRSKEAAREWFVEEVLGSPEDELFGSLKRKKEVYEA